MKIKEGFVTRKIADTIVAVPTGKLVNEFQGMIKLTDSAKFVWDLLQQDTTMDEIVNQYVKKYNIDTNKARTDIEKFITHLKSANIIEE